MTTTKAIDATNKIDANYERDKWNRRYAARSPAEFGDDPIIGTQYSLDGVTWSQEKTIKAGKSGERQKRLVWLQQGTMQNWRTQRFIGTSDAHLSFARLEAQIEPLAF